MKRLHTKVVVVGGGPAGATVSRLLSQSKIENILIEKNLQRDKPCGGGVVSTAFYEFNIPTFLIKNHVKSIRVVSASGLKIDVSLDKGFLAIVERREFDKILREMAQESGSKILGGEFKELFFRDGKPVVMIESKEEKKEIISDYVIAADGVNSRVRKSLLKDLPARLFAMYEIIDDRSNEMCEFWIGSSETPTIYTWVFPHRQGVSVGVVGKGRLEAKKMKEYLFDFLEKRGMQGAGRIRGHHIPIWNNQVYFKNRVFFVGDAAGQVLPVSYEGIYYAMKSAEFAATAIRGNNPSLYKKLWKGRFGKQFLLMAIIEKLFLKSDAYTEKLVTLHKNPGIANASLRLMLEKDLRHGSFFSYIIKLIKEYIRTFKFPH